MSHNHLHTDSLPADINRSFIFGIGLNVIYVIVEITYGFQQNSASLLADATHNVGDISGLLLAFLAFRLMKINANSTFTYGYKKSTIVASFINSVLLAFAIGAIAWEGVQKILSSSPISGTTIMWIALVGVVINFISAMVFKQNQKHDLNIKAAYWHLMADAMVSLGVVVSGILIHFFHWYVLDGLTAIIITFIVLFSTWRLFKDSAIAILDGIPASVNGKELKEHVLAIKGVKDVHHIHIWGISTSENALTAHVVIEEIGDLTGIKKALKEELVEHNIKHSTLEFEIESENCLDKKFL